LVFVGIPFLFERGKQALFAESILGLEIERPCRTELRGPGIMAITQTL
jgi:hypothetical protein